MGVEVVINQSMNLVGDLKDDVATVSTVTAVGATEGNELFAVNGGTTVSTIACTNMENDAINKARHGFLLLFRPAGP